MVVGPETSSASLGVELNIDHPGDGGMGFKKPRGRGFRFICYPIGSSGQQHLLITLSRISIMINMLMWNIRGVSRRPNLRRLIKLV